MAGLKNFAQQMGYSPQHPIPTSQKPEDFQLDLERDALRKGCYCIQCSKQVLIDHFDTMDDYLFYFKIKTCKPCYQKAYEDYRRKMLGGE